MTRDEKIAKGKKRKFEKQQAEAHIEVHEKKSDPVTKITGVTLLKEYVEKVGEPIATDTPLTNVGVSVAKTISDNNFGSTKVSVSLFVPCELKDINKTFKFAAEWATLKMEQLLD